MPLWKDLERFLLHDGWEHRPQNSGSDKSYTKILKTGDILWARVSKSSVEIGRGLFAAILKNQVQTSREYFNKVRANKKHSSDDPSERK
jgi:hypothetical protein